MATTVGYKPFDPKLCEENDKSAKIVAINFLQSMGFTLETPLEKQKEAFKSHDFIIKDTKRRDRKVEVEKKRVWKTSGKWEAKFKEGIHVLMRKTKSQANIFIMVNHSEDTLLIIKPSDYLTSPIAALSTKIDGTGMQTKKEGFYVVPFDKVRFFTKKDADWQEIDKDGNPK